MKIEEDRFGSSRDTIKIRIVEYGEEIKLKKVNYSGDFKTINK